MSPYDPKPQGVHYEISPREREDEQKRFDREFDPEDYELIELWLWTMLTENRGPDGSA